MTLMGSTFQQVASYIIANSQDVIDQRLTELDDLTEEERLAVLRSVVLDVLSTRSAIRGFGSLDPTFLFVYFAGSGGPFADETHPATPATVSTDTYSPWPILEDTRLDFVVDGVTAFSLTMPESYVAEVNAYAGGPYNIYDTPLPGLVANNRFLISLTQPNLGTETLTEVILDGSGDPSSYESWNIANVINAALGGASPIIAQSWLPQEFITNEAVVFNATFPFAGEFTKATGDWDDTVGFQVQLGNQLIVEDAADPNNNGIWEVNDVSGLPATFVAIKVDPAVAVSSGNFSISMTNGKTAVQLTFKDASRLDSVNGLWEIGLPSDRNDPVVIQTLATLGWGPDLSSSSQPVDALFAAEFLNQQPALADLEGNPYMFCSAEFAPIFFSGQGALYPQMPTQSSFTRPQAP